MFTIIINYHDLSNEYKFDQFLDEYVYYIYICVCVCVVLRGLMVTYYEIICIYWLHF